MYRDFVSRCIMMYSDEQGLGYTYMYLDVTCILICIKGDTKEVRKIHVS